MQDTSIKWSTIKFKNFAKLQRGFDLPRQNRIDGKYPVVASTSITAYHNDYKVKAPCVTTGRSGALGEVLFINTDCWPLNTTLWVKDFCDNDPKFVYYKLKTLELKKFNAGAGVPTLNKNHLDNLEIQIPSIEGQKKITSVLSAYDDLIENNDKRIKALEEMAQLLYTEWFVKFKFPDHEKVRIVDSGTGYGMIPEGWEVKRLGQLLNNIKNSTCAGEHLSTRKYIPIENIPKKSLIIREFSDWKKAQSSLILFEKDDILFGAMRPYFHKVSVAKFPGVTRTTCLVLRPKNDNLRLFGLLTVFSDNFIIFASSNTQGATIPYSVWENSLENYSVPLPVAKTLDQFEETLAPFIDEMNIIAEKNNILSQMRDLLIQQLITGRRILKNNL